MRKPAVEIVLAILAVVHLPIAKSASAVDRLSTWHDGDAKEAIIAFVERTTDKDGPDFVPPAERIAVFDNDGTLWCEQPMYVQLAFALNRVQTLAPQHPEWKGAEPFKSVLAGDMRAVAATGEKGVLQLVAATHAGVTAAEFEQIVLQWLQTAKHPKFDRPYVQCIYQPQLELLEYLRDNGFKTFIVSGGGVDFMRPWTEAAFGIPPEQVVGSAGKLKYEVRDGTPVLTKLPEVDFIDDKAGKPVGIHKSIGRRPILAVGNSDGDYEMLEYVTASDPGPSRLRLGLLIHHTDAEREYAYDRQSPFGRLDRALDDAPKKGWIVVDMQRDWKQIVPSAE